MSFNNNQESFTYELEYKSTNNSRIKLFDIRFVNKNKEKCNIIYNDIKFDLMEYFNFDNNNHNHNDSIKIQLRINNDIEDTSFMFNDCKELLSIRDIPANDFSIADINESFYENNSNNSSEKSYNSNETEESENFYNDNLILSTIQQNTNSSLYNEIYDLKFHKENILSNCTNMSYMFYGCSSLKSLPDLSKWDTKNVTNMSYMFYRCSSLKSLPDISKWDTKNVTNMSNMFRTFIT